MARSYILRGFCMSPRTVQTRMFWLPAGHRLGPDPKLELTVYSSIDYDVSLNGALVRTEEEFNQIGTEHSCVISPYSYPIFKVGVRDAASPCVRALVYRWYRTRNQTSTLLHSTSLFTPRHHDALPVNRHTHQDVLN